MRVGFQNHSRPRVGLWHWSRPNGEYCLPYKGGAICRKPVFTVWSSRFRLLLLQVPSTYQYLTAIELCLVVHPSRGHTKRTRAWPFRGDTTHYICHVLCLMVLTRLVSTLKIDTLVLGSFNHLHIHNTHYEVLPSSRRFEHNISLL